MKGRYQKPKTIYPEEGADGDHLEEEKDDDDGEEEGVQGEQGEEEED